MHLKVITAKNVTRLYYYETYRKDGKIKNRVVESLGKLDDLKKNHDDPITHFKKVALERTKHMKQEIVQPFSINMIETLKQGDANYKNVGYTILKQLYYELELDKFWKQKTQGRSYTFDVEAIFRLLVISRVLYPASKKETYERKNIYFETIDGFDLNDVYRALDVIDENQETLQKWIFNHSKNLCDRDVSVTYFDCTNYYFDIGCPDTDILGEDRLPVDKAGNRAEPAYRKRGAEKNHRPDPIVQMGLLMDRNGIPLAYDLFPGNESEKVHLRPIINRVKTEFIDSRIIFVADRGLNTSDNIYFLNGDNKGKKNTRDGYVYGQSVRGADAAFKKWVLAYGCKETIVEDDDGSKVTFIHKSRIYPKELHVNLTVPGRKNKKKTSVAVDQKQMVYFSQKYARKQRKNRDVMIARAKDLIKYPKKYDKVTAAGSAGYVKNIAFDKTTGEIIEDRVLELDMDKIQEEAKYDGYYSIVTSELELSDLEMRNIYRGLARIEETFKISKSDFLSRPVFVRTNEHIDAHFAACFTALVLIRLLQGKLKNRHPVGRLLESLRNYCCTNIGVNIWQFVYFDEILHECEKVFGLSLDHKYRTQQEVRRLLRY